MKKAEPSKKARPSKKAEPSTKAEPSPPPATLCEACRELVAQKEFPTHRVFPRLRHILDGYHDEFVDFDYYACRDCKALWRESYSTYNTDQGWHWDLRTWAHFLKACPAQPPEGFEPTEEGWLAWIEERKEPLYLETGCF